MGNKQFSVGFDELIIESTLITATITIYLYQFNKPKGTPILIITFINFYFCYNLLLHTGP